MVGSHNFELTFLVLKNQVHFWAPTKKRWKVKTLLEGVFCFVLFFCFGIFPRNLMDSFQNLLGGGLRRVTNLFVQRHKYKSNLHFLLVFLEPYMKDWSTSFHIFLAKTKKKGFLPTFPLEFYTFLFNLYRLTIAKDIIVHLYHFGIN
jgi:hypothetical protein